MRRCEAGSARSTSSCPAFPSGRRPLILGGVHDDGRGRRLWRVRMHAHMRLLVGQGHRRLCIRVQGPCGVVLTAEHGELGHVLVPPSNSITTVSRRSAVASVVGNGSCIGREHGYCSVLVLVASLVPRTRRMSSRGGGAMIAPAVRVAATSAAPGSCGGRLAGGHGSSRTFGGDIRVSRARSTRAVVAAWGCVVRECLRLKAAATRSSSECMNWRSAISSG